jgi:hypothetical protein
MSVNESDNFPGTTPDDGIGDSQKHNPRKLQHLAETIAL